MIRQDVLYSERIRKLYFINRPNGNMMQSLTRGRNFLDFVLSRESNKREGKIFYSERVRWIFSTNRNQEFSLHYTIFLLFNLKSAIKLNERMKYWSIIWFINNIKSTRWKSKTPEARLLSFSPLKSYTEWSFGTLWHGVLRWKSTCKWRLRRYFIALLGYYFSVFNFFATLLTAGYINRAASS